MYVCFFFPSAHVQVDTAPEFDVNSFSNKYMAPLQYITWRKMFKSLKPGNFASDVLHYTQTFELKTGSGSLMSVTMEKSLEFINI